MTNTFPATLHNRTDKTQRAVTVRITSGTLHITAETEAWRWSRTDLTSARLVDDGSVILQNGSWFLDVPDPRFAPALEAGFGGKKLFRRSFFDKIGVSGCLLAFVLVVLPLLAAYFWLAPYIAEQAVGNVSPETEKQIGEAWFRSLTEAYTVDTVRTRQVQQFCDSLHFGGDYDLRITVVNEPVVNAFALPGGHIVVFDSILAIMDAPEQLAGLLAHEAAHVQLRHSTRAVFQELARNLFFTLLLGDDGSLSGIVARQSDKLLGLSYSRRLEMEADAHGLRLLERSGIPRRGMPDLFRKMGAATGDSSGIPSFLSTHPAIEERIQSAENERTNDIARDTVPAVLQRIWAELKKRTH
ncbi:MAG: M48 family metallopeptidase [Lewinellaceae bacterium]|nr:M48 family metallopeptidase [Lewinellaceae bacterium]